MSQPLLNQSRVPRKLIQQQSCSFQVMFTPTNETDDSIYLTDRLTELKLGLTVDVKQGSWIS